MTFKEEISQEKVIEEVIFQYGEIKMVKKENNNHGHGSNKSGSIN